MCGWIHWHSGNWRNLWWSDDLVQAWELPSPRGWEGGVRIQKGEMADSKVSASSSAPCQSLQGNILGVGVRTRLLTVAGLKPLESLWAPLLLWVVSQRYGRELGALLVSTAGRHGKDWVQAGTSENKLASLSTFQVISTFHHWHFWGE